MSVQKRFHRHFPVKGYPLYWIIIAYLVIGYFFPVVGLLALICMVGPVLMSVWRGRYWCGNICPRGNFFDRVLSRYSPHRPIPAFVRTVGFPYSPGYKVVHVDSTCQMKCKNCARVCPMQLTPYESRGEADGYLHYDCIKCGKCVQACPTKIMKMGRVSDK